MRAFGCFPRRHVGPESEAAALQGEGFRFWDDLLTFLAEYTGLEIASEDGARSIWIDARRSIRETGIEWGQAYSKAIQSARAPVGGYPHTAMYLSQDGKFYGGFDGEYGCLAPNFRGLVDVLLNQTHPVSLDGRIE
jgi:hypothetical protein